VSDFDALLERMVADPAFLETLAADPSRALAGYDLDPGERELLTAQVVAGSGADRTVEVRTSKSGLTGLLGAFAATFGVAGAHQSLGASVSRQVLAPHTGDQAVGSVSGHEAFGSSSGHEAFGSSSGHEAFGSSSGHEAFGSSAGHEAFGSTSGDGTGDAPAHEQPEGSFGTFAGRVVAADYHTRIRVDGDGDWDNYTAYERGDGGVDIVHVDDHGRIDFVGHDYNRDGLVDDADFDTNGDGVLDTRMYDDDGDGWMDRSEKIPGTT
jgi:hypothetical protein